MGSELVNSASHVLYTDIFNRFCPFYMSVGMSYDDFWNGDCILTNFYRKAFELKQRRKNDESWMLGKYFYEGLIAVAPALRGLSNAPIENYLREPYPYDEEEVKERKIRDDKERIEKFRQNAIAFNERRKKQEERGETNGND